MTVRTVRSISRLRSRGEQEVERLGRGDQDVRRLPEHRRALGGGVSPVRTAAVIFGVPKPISSASRRISRRGSARFFWMSLLSALSGET